jgi:hypothetical protein
MKVATGGDAQLMLRLAANLEAELHSLFDQSTLKLFVRHRLNSPGPPISRRSIRLP